METFSALVALCAGNSPVPAEFPSQRPVTRSFYLFFHLRLNKRLSKQSWGWWFETPSSPLWRHSNVDTISQQWAYLKSFLIEDDGSNAKACSHKMLVLASKELTHIPLDKIADDIFICIFVNEKVYILIKISLKFVSKGLQLTISLHWFR